MRTLVKIYLDSLDLWTGSCYGGKMATKKKTPGAPKAKKAARMTDFGRYLKAHDIKRDDVAKGVDVSAPYIHMLCSGSATPSFKLAGRIAEFTAKASGGEGFGLEAWKK